MQLQEVTALPVDPLATLDSDYGQAVLHLAWDLHKRTRELTLLFAFVELLPVEIPPPVDDGCSTVELAGSEHRVFVRHFVVPARRAVEWYLRCRQGDAVLPEDDGTLLGPGEGQARKLRLVELGEDPPWPSLVCAEFGFLPFCPVWHEQPRVHQLVPLAELDVKALWPRGNDWHRAIDFLTERLHFDVADYPEYRGSVHLVAPNPVYRIHEQRRTPSSTSSAERIVLEIEPRAGLAGFTGLEIQVEEERAAGKCSTVRASIRGPLTVLQFPHRLRSPRETVRDEARGVLEVTQGVFLNAIVGSLAVGSQQRREVALPAAGRRAFDKYEVALTSARRTVAIGATHERGIPSAGSKIASGRRAREALRAERELKQRWLDNEVDEATSLIRGLLARATRDVLLVDPYFGSTELLRFTLAVGQVDTPISILSSAEFLTGKNSERAAPPEDTYTEPGELLYKQLVELLAKESMNPIAIRVMPGKHAPIHDRFLVIDDRIWLLGSSLNEFGSRGTMIVELPHPELVRGRLREAWSAAEPIETWILLRRERKSRIERGDG